MLAASSGRLVDEAGVEADHGLQVGAAAGQLQRHRAAEAEPDGGDLVGVGVLAGQQHVEAGGADHAGQQRVAGELQEAVHDLVVGQRLAVAVVVEGERHVAQLGQPAGPVLGVVAQPVALVADEDRRARARGGCRPRRAGRRGAARCWSTRCPRCARDPPIGRPSGDTSWWLPGGRSTTRCRRQLRTLGRHARPRGPSKEIPHAAAHRDHDRRRRRRAGRARCAVRVRVRTGDGGLPLRRRVVVGARGRGARLVRAAPRHPRPALRQLVLRGPQGPPVPGRPRRHVPRRRPRRPAAPEHGPPVPARCRRRRWSPTSSP